MSTSPSAMVDPRSGTLRKWTVRTIEDEGQAEDQGQFGGRGSSGGGVDRYKVEVGLGT